MRIYRTFVLALVVGLGTVCVADVVERDIVVYGGTSAGVTAAVQAKRMGKSVVLVCPDRHLGGLSSGGLGFTDTGDKSVIGGLAREFYQRVWQHYQTPEAWRWQKREEYGNKGQGTPAIDGAQRTMWIFEPHVAEKVFEDLVKEAGIEVRRDEWLDRGAGGVEKAGPRIVGFRTLSGNVYRGKTFLDATYEGDLMAAAGVSYHVGREANAVYGETWNGIQVGVLHHGHYFKKPVSASKVPGDPKSGLVARISAEPPGVKGEGDKRIQAYCYRMCLSRSPENRVPFPKPEEYDPSQYELLARVFETGWRETFEKFDPIPNLKTDTNNHGPFSTDNIGLNYDYPEGSYERRREILKEHETYQKGLMYFLQNDPRVPEDVRAEMAKWGLPTDEFRDNGGWPHQIYVREARRMIGAYVMTDQDCLDQRATPDSVGMGSYAMDSHNVQRYVTPEGNVQNEGDIGVAPPRPYEIAYGSLVPKKAECENLLVPVCLSSSHIAYGSIRMEPVFMILGQSAATAAAMAQEAGIAVQDLPYAELRKRLVADGQVLEKAGGPPTARLELEGVVVDDLAADFVGEWATSTVNRPHVAQGYRHDSDGGKGQCRARFVAKLKPGRYEVRLIYPPNSNRAGVVPVAVHHAEGVAKCAVDERKGDEKGRGVAVLGTFAFGPEGVVEVSNAGTKGHVVVDAVQFVAIEGR